ncbi:MAG TPA: LuxR C-terminal-related transcriptional regulator [Actinophytocola sp.]|uniref:response regulator transcription factor n=1 Tax=Actinophytocola sp. TaxID=1872138 RepID=UPI002DFEBB4D|nr:LuxR C-terminal-related transcriptional regulator [Actinophytocola sp.]
MLSTPLGHPRRRRRHQPPAPTRRPRPHGPRGTGTLTTREQEVLTLLGEGLSNPDIAARRYVSRRTAEHHVSNILAKLGLTTRAEAAAYAVKQSR